MIRHIVILQFYKDGKDYLRLMKQTIPLVKQIPGIVSYELFPNQSKYIPQNITSIGLEIKFKDQNALDVFMTHPNHYKANAIFEKYLANPPYMVLTHPI
jgi:quinol monooxygenase YgiN